MHQGAPSCTNKSGYLLSCDEMRCLRITTHMEAIRSSEAYIAVAEAKVRSVKEIGAKAQHMLESAVSPTRNKWFSALQPYAL